jgi:hypothetical protein
MKRIGAVVLVIMVLVGCKNNDNIDPPNKVFAGFADAFSKRDMAKVRSLCTADSKMTLDILEKKSKDMGMPSMKQFDTSKVTFGEAVIQGDNAVLPIKEKESGTTIDFPLKKEDGVWKIAFDAKTLWDLVNETIRKEGLGEKVPGLDSMLEKYKNINLDSLGEALMKGNDTVRIKH